MHNVWHPTKTKHKWAIATARVCRFSRELTIQNCNKLLASFLFLVYICRAGHETKTEMIGSVLLEAQQDPPPNTPRPPIPPPCLLRIVQNSLIGWESPPKINGFHKKILKGSVIVKAPCSTKTWKFCWLATNYGCFFLLYSFSFS